MVRCEIVCIVHSHEYMNNMMRIKHKQETCVTSNMSSFWYRKRVYLLIMSHAEFAKRMRNSRLDQGPPLNISCQEVNDIVGPTIEFIGYIACLVQ